MNAPSLVWTKDVETFMGFVKINRETSCWEWTRYKNEWGYGHFTRNKKRMLVHRRLFSWLYGPIPDGVLLCHHCDNPACVNPTHIYEGTPSSNMLDMASRGRGKFWSRPGEQSPTAKLTEAQAREIADTARWGSMSQREVAELYGIKKGAVSAIRCGRAWKHLREVGNV